LHHYTDQRGLLGIFQSGEFWATKIQYMNDATEFEYSLGLAHAIIYSSITNHLITNSIEKRQCSLLQWMIDHLDAIGAANICAVSFCTDPDLLSQWRGYAGLGMGYAIGFYSKGLSEIADKNSCRLGRCIYEQASQKQIINELIDEALTRAKDFRGKSVENSHLIVGAAFERALVECGAFFKDASFKDEREWRLITEPRQFNEEAFRFREGKSMLTPYCALKMRSERSWANKIAGVTVGPCPHTDGARKAIEGLLMKELGDPSPPVTVSKIPYRSW
jgi:hypothetical protein